MKIYGKQVFIGSKKICVEYTSRIIGGFSDCMIGNYDYKGEDLEKDVIFVKDKKGCYVELEDIKAFPTLSLICYGAAPRWKTSPNKAGDEYIDEIKPYFSKSNQETLYDLNTLIKIIETEKLQTSKEDSMLTN